MDCSIPEEVIHEVVHFHGHQCPGLAIGIRAAEYAKKIFPETDASSLVCVAETDMCGVDAIQFLTGCTFGKGNFIHRDYGKTAFSFFDRKRERGIRLLFNDGVRGEQHGEIGRLMSENLQGTISEQDRERLQSLRKEMENSIMTLPLEELFSATEITAPPPRPARIMQSLTCQSCGEKTMESRTRRFAGQTLCIPCFDMVEQKR